MNPNPNPDPLYKRAVLMLRPGSKYMDKEGLPRIIDGAGRFVAYAEEGCGEASAWRMAYRVLTKDYVGD